MLAKIMHLLTSAHVFEEVRDEHYANNRISASLVNNEPLRACIMILYVPSKQGIARIY